MLLRHLPRDSAYVQAVNGERARWGDTEHLLAGIIDVLQAGNYLTTRAHFKGNQQPPKPMRRPGDRPAVDGKRVGNRSRTNAEMAEILARWRAGTNPAPPEEVDDGR